MNTHMRPSRAPAPPPETTYAEHTDASFQEVERPNNLPARSNGAQQVQPIPDHTEPEQAALPVTGFEKLAAAIAGVMAEIKPVEKEGWNDFHKYNYAKMQDLSRELTPLMGKHGIVIFQTEEGREMFDEGRAVAVRYRFTIVHSSGQIWPERPIQTGLSMCRTSNGKFDDKTLNKCHTSARKYFLLSLFQIPTSDDDDADSGQGQSQGETANRPRPQGQGRRPVPSPTGKLPPHILPVIDGEAPQVWAARFGAFVAKAESSAEIDKWYSANVAIFDKLKAGNFMQIYNDAIDFMDACAAKLAGGKSEGKPDPISSGKPASDFPGDKKPPARAQDDGNIPWGLDRKLSDSDRDWLMSLKEAFDQCTQVEEIGAEQDSIMMSAQGNVSAYVWQKAVDLVAQHIERING